MKIYTGNFANTKKYTAAGLFPVSIALSARYFNGALYRKLNPDYSYMNDLESEYVPKFNQKLKNLSAKSVIKELEELSLGKDVVLLCHEKAGEFCHRRLVADWLNRELGIEVMELGKMEDSYSSEFVKKTQESRDEIKNGKCKKIQTEMIWE